MVRVGPLHARRNSSGYADVLVSAGASFSDDRRRDYLTIARVVARPRSGAPSCPGRRRVSQERRHSVEHELDEWRKARRRGDAAEHGSAAEVTADEDAEEHRVEFERLTELTREEAGGRAEGRQPGNQLSQTSRRNCCRLRAWQRTGPQPPPLGELASVCVTGRRPFDGPRAGGLGLICGRSGRAGASDRASTRAAAPASPDPWG